MTALKKINIEDLQTIMETHNRAQTSSDAANARCKIRSDSRISNGISLIGTDQKSNNQKTKYIVLFYSTFCILAQVTLMLSINLRAFDYMKHFDIDQKLCNSAALIYLIVGLIAGTIITFKIDDLGLMNIIYFTSLVQFFGSGIRLLGFYYHDYRICLVGQGISALCRGINMVPGKVANEFFENESRTQAASFMTLGNSMGFIMTSVLSGMDLSLESYNLITTMPQLLAGPGVLVLIFMLRKEAFKKEEQKEEQKKVTWLADLKSLFQNKDFLLLAACRGTTVALAITFSQLFEQLLCPLGYNHRFVGLKMGKGFLAKIANIATSSNIGLAIISIIILIQTMVLTGTMGLAINLTIESTFPVRVGLSNGLVWILTNVLATCYVIFITQFPSETHSHSQIQNSDIKFNVNSDQCNLPNIQNYEGSFSKIQYFTLSFLLLFVVFYKCQYLRSRAEQRMVIEKMETDEFEDRILTKDTLLEEAFCEDLMERSGEDLCFVEGTDDF